MMTDSANATIPDLEDSPEERQTQKQELRTLQVCKNPNCGKTLPVAESKKKQREYCDEKCRKQAYNARLDLTDDDKRTLKFLTSRFQGSGELPNPAALRRDPALLQSANATSPDLRYSGKERQTKKDPKPWLTLKEAAEYSGLPIGWLRQKCIEGSLGVRTSPSESHPEWRIRKSDLDEGVF
jgi:hypothetical protein